MVDLDKVNSAKGIQHWSLAPRQGLRFTKEELEWFPIRVRQLLPTGFNKYEIAKVIASEVGRSIASLRYQLWHSMKLWPKLPKEFPIYEVGGIQPVTNGTISVGRYWQAVDENTKLQQKILQLERRIGELTNKGGRKNGTTEASI